MVSALALAASSPHCGVGGGMPGWASEKHDPSLPSTGQQPSFSCKETLSQQRTSLKEATVLRWERSVKASVGQQRRHTKRPELVYKKDAETI